MKAVKTMAAPAAIGPYSQGIVAGGFLFVSGQIPMDPASGQMIAGGIAEQTHRVLQNIKAIAEAAGADLNRVVKTTVYLKDLADFQVMNAVYAEYFSTTPPARATVQVAALPKNSAIEIDAVVCLETTGAS